MNARWSNYEQNVQVRDWGKTEYGEETNYSENVQWREMEMEKIVGRELAGQDARQAGRREKSERAEENTGTRILHWNRFVESLMEKSWWVWQLQDNV